MLSSVLPAAARRHLGTILVAGGTVLVLLLAVRAGEPPGAHARGLGAVDPAVVVAEVPARGRDRELRELETLAASLAGAPRDGDLAVRFAELALARGRRDLDPRWVGRAQAALAPWWAEAAPPTRILLLRAIIKQSRHDFPGALVDLDRVLAVAPGEVEARLVRAVVLTVLGRYAEAERTCADLDEADGFGRLACVAPARAALGRHREVLAALERALAALGPRADAAAWAHALAGEIAFWAGDLGKAEAHLRRAHLLDPGDGYTRTALADLLLDAGRADEVITLLDGRADDASLLRLALAHHRRKDAQAAPLVAELAARFAAAERRGDATHAREEARFALALADDPARALAKARASWQVQREPWDARLVLAAAARLDEAGALAAEVARFVADRGGAWARAEAEVRR